MLLQRTTDASTVLNQLYENYELEGLEMPYTIEDFRRDFTREHLGLLTPEERLRGLPAKERLRGLSAEEIEAYLKELQSFPDSISISKPGSRKGP